MERCAVAGALALAAALVRTATAHAGGPLVVATDGQPVGWSTASPVAYVTDQGGLGVLANSTAVSTVEALFGTWASVPTATIAFTRAGSTAVDVDATNFGPYLGPYGGATSPLGQSVIVFDADGSIFDTLFGVGTGILGFAGPTFMTSGATTVPIGDLVPPGAVIVEGLAFLNGKWIDGVNDPGSGNYELPLASFEAVFVHEFGHFAGLDHTQIHGGRQPTDSDLPGPTQPVETMYSFFQDAGQATLERDDVVALSVLYPSAGFAASTGRITGRVLTTDGVPLSGANVIARNVADDADAVSYVSGATLTPTGTFSLAGLTPGASYRVEVQEVDAYAAGGSRVGPFSPPVILPGPPEFYSGTAESSDPVSDDAASSAPITVSAGATAGGIDITLNHQGFSVVNVLLDGRSQLQEFAVGDFDGDTVPDFVAPQFGFSPGNLTRFYRGLGDGTFAAPVLIDAFPGGEHAVAGQFNSDVDAFLDVAVASSSLNQVRVYFGDGSGGFPTTVTVLDLPDNAENGPVDLAAGDLNGDAFPDLFTLTRGSSTVGGTAYALLGGPAGTFTPVTTAFAVGSGFPGRRLLLAQVAGSSATDVVGLSSTMPPVIGLLIGNGAGGFTPMPVPMSAISTRFDGYLEGIDVGDFNEDGTIDLAVADLQPLGGAPNYTRSYIDILLGDGTGAFSLSHRYAVPESFQSAIVVTDLDGDGHLDIASTDASFAPGSPGAKVNLATGDGTGAVTSVTTLWGLAEFPRALAAADLDVNGTIDLLVSDSAGSPMGLSAPSYYSILLQNLCGNGTVEPPEQCDDGNFTSGDGCDTNCTPTGCGNGIVSPGEQCDDGNIANGDCCSATCQFDPTTVACAEDGDLCTRDLCDGAGGCVHSPGPPRTGCRLANQSLLLIKDRRNDARDKLVWKWLLGAPTSVAEFGDPRTTTTYSLCVYAGSAAAPVARVTVPPNFWTWKPIRQGFKYGDAFGTRDGVRHVLLKGSADQTATAVVKGKGYNLPSATLGNLPAPIVAQLVNSSTPVCWENRFDSGDLLYNTAEKLKAKTASP